MSASHHRGVGSTPVDVGFVGNELAMGQFMFPVLQFSLSTSFHQCCIFIHLSPVLFDLRI
jgi:hypothetical protein